MRFLFLMFMVVPILEMWLLIHVGGAIGALPTIALVALTAIVGINLLRQQGISTLWRAQQRMNSGEMPVHEMVEGLLLAVGGALLLTPGFVTDSIGFACLIPGLRGLIVAAMSRHFTVMQARPGGPSGQSFDHSGDDHRQSASASQAFGHSQKQNRASARSVPLSSRAPERNRRGDTLEGEFDREDP